MVIRGLKIEYEGRTVLDIDGLETGEGITVVLGPNGAGKSTLLKALAGAIKCRTLTLEGAPEKLAYMAQKPYMFRMSAVKNVLVGMEKGEESERYAREALRTLGMERFCDKPANASRLSGGEKQRVALARTLAIKPGLALLDEPSSAADINGVTIVEEYIKKAAQGGAAILMTTHDPAQAIRIGDRAVFLWEGRVAETGTPRELLETPKTPEAKLFTERWRG